MKTRDQLPPSSPEKKRAKQKRRRFKQTSSLQKRLAAFASEMRAQAAATPPGTEHDDFLKRADQADAAADMTTGLLPTAKRSEE